MNEDQQQQAPGPQPNDPKSSVEPDAQAQTDPMAALRSERDGLFDRLARVSADYQNYIRRSNQSLADSIELAKGDFARQFIPVLDHFENALAAQPKGDEARVLHEGVKIVRDELLRVLKSAGVEVIPVSIGDRFDPQIHEALLRQPAEGVQPDHVSMLMQNGYKYGSRTLRPAKVGVAPQ